MRASCTTHKLEQKMTVNVNEVFDSLDQRRAAALATIAKYTPEQAAEASRVALMYDRCAVTSIKHAEDTARQLRELFGAPLVKPAMNQTAYLLDMFCECAYDIPTTADQLRAQYADYIHDTTAEGFARDLAMSLDIDFDELARMVNAS
jgi:hypothetical protein